MIEAVCNLAPDAKKRFDLHLLPSELQQLILAQAVEIGVSPTSLLCLSSHYHHEVLGLVYQHIRIPSLVHLLSLLSNASEVGNHAARYTHSFTLNIPGVPGGSTRGGRESAPGSPTRESQQSTLTKQHLNDRLLLASKAILLCPRLRHCFWQMFGVRHSSLLTSADYLTEETNTFRNAIAQLRYLEIFSWTTPNSFVGISIAVVDLAFDPLVEGLELAALDMDVNGRRVIPSEPTTNRYSHPLQQIILHHCIFPSDQGRRFFQLFTKRHPDDRGHLLFQHVKTINIKMAINVDPVNVALLALSWQLQIDACHAKSEDSDIWSPMMILEDVYINSIWGPRLSMEGVKEGLQALTSSKSLLLPDNESLSDNPYIRVLEESVSSNERLDEDTRNQIKSLTRSQRESLVRRACGRLEIRSVQGAVASYQ